MSSLYFRAIKRFFGVLWCGLAVAAPGAVAVAEELGEGLQNPGYEEPPAWFKVSFLDLREDLAEARESGKGLMLYFYQDGCPYCKRLLEENFGDPAIAEATRSHFDVVALNLWGDREVTDLNGEVRGEKAFAEFARVMFTPTLVLFSPEGKVALRINGYYPPARFKAAIDYVAGGHYREAPFGRWLATRQPPAEAGELHQEAGFMAPPFDLSQRSDGRPLLVVFEEKGCDACDELHRDGFSRPEVQEMLAKFDRVQLDRWAATPLVTPDGRSGSAAEWANMLGIQYTPSLVMFDTAGKEVFRAEAYLRPFHLRNALGYVTSGGYLRQPSFQRYIEGVADAMRERGEPIELMR